MYPLYNVQTMHKFMKINVNTCRHNFSLICRNCRNSNYLNASQSEVCGLSSSPGTARFFLPQVLPPTVRGHSHLAKWLYNEAETWGCNPSSAPKTAGTDSSNPATPSTSDAVVKKKKMYGWVFDLWFSVCIRVVSCDWHDRHHPRHGLAREANPWSNYSLSFCHHLITPTYEARCEFGWDNTWKHDSQRKLRTWKDIV